MKKLLITTMAAVSVGLCAKAADDGFISGTSFDEGLNVGDAFNPTDTCWTLPTDTDDEFKITNVTYSADATKQHWDWTDGEKALSIDTANPILRNVNPEDGVNVGNAAQDVSTNPVFFDSVVQFTATDVRPQVDVATNKDKLSVWLYASPENLEEGAFEETEAKTNLVITAGYRDGGSLVQKDYLTGVKIAPETWHRLTIKSFIADSGYLVFNVFIDGQSEPISVDGVTDFLSLVPVNNAIEDIKLQGVAFDGKGVVDDIVFTTTDPFEVPSYTVTVNIADVDEWASDCSKQYSIDGTQYLDFNAGDVLSIPETASKIWFKIAIPYGAKLEGVDNSAGEDGNGNYYWIKEVNVADIIRNGEGEVVLTVVEDEGGDEPDPAKPTVGGVEVVVDDNGKITNITTANNGQVVSGEITDAMFADYYAVSVVDGKLVIAIDPAVATPQINATSDDADDAIVVTETAVALGVTNAKVGLWYGVQAYSDAACTTKIGDEPTGWEQAEGETVTVTVVKPDAGTAFFKVVVDDQDHTPATPPAEQE